MKTSILGSLLLLAMIATFPATAAEAPVAPEPAAAPVQPEAPTVDLPADAASCPAPDAGLLLPAPLEMGWGCPFGVPFCKVDDDCDDWCGDPAFGACEAPGCCSCYG